MQTRLVGSNMHLESIRKNRSYIDFAVNNMNNISVSFLFYELVDALPMLK